MNKNIDKEKSEPQILLERYSKCKIPIGKIYKSFFESKNIGMESMMRAFSEARDIKDLKDVCNSVIQSKKIELENLKKSYESFDEAKKNYCKSFYEEVFSSKKFILKRWESEYKSLLEAEQKNGATKYQTKNKHIMNMCIFCFIKSPEFGDDKWHLNFIDSGWMKDSFEENKDVEYVSYCDENGKRRLYRTSEMMFLVNNQSLAHMLIDRTVDSEIQIKLLKAAGFKEFTVQFDKKKKDSWTGEIEGNELKIVDEKGNGVSSVNEKYQKLDRNFYRELNKNSDCEYINLAHIDVIDRFDCKNKDTIDSVIVLSKNAEMYNFIEEPYAYQYDVFYGTKNPLTFYLEPGAKVATDILSKFRDEEKYPEFYNATIVFMSPKLVADYQGNLDNVDTYVPMKEFIKPYEANKDYFSFKLSDYSDYSNQRIEQLSHAQTDFSDTWANFVGFMEKIGVKEKSDANKNVDKNDEKKEKENEIGKSEDKNEKGLKNNNKTSTQDVAVDDREKGDDTGKLNKNNKIRESDDKSRQGLKIGIKPIDKPEENLSGFMRYLKNHWPMIFKFLNVICNFFSWFKSKFKSSDKNSLVDKGVDNINHINLKQSLIGKTSNLSSQKSIVNRPDNMENQPVINQENSMQQEK